MHVQVHDTGVERGDIHGILLEQKHYNGCVLRSRAPPGNGLSGHLTALFSVRCPFLLAQGCQAIRGTSAGQRVELGFAVGSLQIISRPPPLGDSTPIASFIIGGVARPLHAS
jgi:hypothetical protein